MRDRPAGGVIAQEAPRRGLKDDVSTNRLEDAVRSGGFRNHGGDLERIDVDVVARIERDISRRGGHVAIHADSIKAMGASISPMMHCQRCTPAGHGLKLQIMMGMVIWIYLSVVVPQMEHPP